MRLDRAPGGADRCAMALPTVHILILAAGASSRMRGTDKLMQLVGDRPLLRRVAEVAIATIAPVHVTLPPESSARRGALSGLPVIVTEVPDAAHGMSRSLRTGLDAVAARNPGAQDGLMILPADMPGFTAAALTEMIVQFQAAPDQIIRGVTDAGRPGHPAIFPRRLWPALAAVEGDEGGRSVLRNDQRPVRVICLPGTMAVLDLDTPEDWASFRSGPAPLD